MLLQPIIGHIAAQCPAFRAVGGAVDLSAAMDGLSASPAAYVVPLREAAERDAAGGLIEIAGEFGVLVAVSAARGKSAAPRDDITALVAAVRAALEGYRLEGARAVQWKSGALHAFAPGVAWYLDSYRVAYPQ